MRAVLLYGAVAAAVLAGLAAGVSVLVGAAQTSALWLAAAIAWAVQLVAFAALVVGREGPRFMAMWVGGILLRFAVVGVVAVWLTRTGAFDAATALVGLVGFVFVLVLLEPLFLRLAD